MVDQEDGAGLFGEENEASAEAAPETAAIDDSDEVEAASTGPVTTATIIDKHFPAADAGGVEAHQPLRAFLHELAAHLGW